MGQLQFKDFMAALELDVTDARSVMAAASELSERFPDLNVLFNNAGISRPEDLVADEWDLGLAEATVATNITGVIRLTGALLPALKRMPNAAVVTTTSGLAYVPLASHPTYSVFAFLASVAAPPAPRLGGGSAGALAAYVQTDLGGPQQRTDPHAMPLDAYADEVVTLLKVGDTPNGEVLVRRVLDYRSAERESRHDKAFAQGNPT